MACERPWPCAVAREELARDFAWAPTVLEVYLATCMAQATEDLTAHGAALPADLPERFFGWVRP